MKRILFILVALGPLARAVEAPETVILSETGVKNLRIETVAARESDFEEIAFALGRIEAAPGATASVTSRISGRVVELGVIPGDPVLAGTTVARVESRQPGNPASVIPLNAPIAGVVMSIDVHLGDPVEPDRPIMEIVDLGKLQAVAQIPESLAGRLAPGVTARIGVTALPAARFTGRFVRMGTKVDPGSGTIDAVFELDGPVEKLRPGMRAETSVILSRRSGVVSVPRAALQGDRWNRFVFVKDFELQNAFVRAPVVVGEMNDEVAEIVSGLLPADEVVTRGAYSLAFAGGAGVSLKEALDAAHGHEHNEDGSEISSKTTAAAGESGAESPFWMMVSGVLFVLLIVAVLRCRGGAHAG